MDIFELKREQSKLAVKIQLHDAFTTVKTVGGMACVEQNGKLITCVVVCELPSLQVLEKKTYVLTDPLRYRDDLIAYREMPALLEAFNQLEQEPDVLLVHSSGIAHPRRMGVASHIGLLLQKSTIGVEEKLSFGRVEDGKIVVSNDVCGFEVTTREFSKPVYASPGHLITLGSTLRVVQQTIQYPHKLPEPLHIARKVAKKKAQELV